MHQILKINAFRFMLALVYLERAIFPNLIKSASLDTAVKGKASRKTFPN